MGCKQMGLVTFWWSSSFVVMEQYTRPVVLHILWVDTSGKKICLRTHRLRPDAPGARDTLTAPCQRTYRSQHKTHRQCEFRRSSPRYRASRRRSPWYLLTGWSMAGHFPSGRTVSGHFPSGRSRVSAFSYWTRPDDTCHASMHQEKKNCVLSVRTQLATASAYRTERVRAFSFWTQLHQSIFLLDAAVSGQIASGRRASWHRSHAGYQGMEHRSKYSRRIRKHAEGSRHSDSVQFYSLYLIYIYICYYHTSRGNKGKLANTTQCVEHDAMSTM